MVARLASSSDGMCSYLCILPEAKCAGQQAYRYVAATRGACSAMGRSVAIIALPMIGPSMGALCRDAKVSSLQSRCSTT